MIEVENNLLEKFTRVRNHSTFLCEPLKAEDYVVQPVMDVSPPKWHLAHTTWFFEQFVLVPNKKDYKVYDTDFSYMFNSYYEHVGERVLRADRGNMTRPSTDDIKKYRLFIDAAMEEFLSEAELSQNVQETIELGLQHEQQHQELLVTDIKYILGNNPLFPVYRVNTIEPEKMEARKARFLDVPEGIYEIGFEGNGFHFDNEEARHKIYLQPYKIMDRMITNQEYMEFMLDAGYNDFRFWLSEGWEWCKALQTKAPMYWHKMDQGWYRYTLNGLKPVNPFAPVTHISYFEADAYARWKGKRLPTEFEWEVASNGILKAEYDKGNFVEALSYDTMPASVDNNQMFGDAWEWTSSAYLPYPGFKTIEGAVGEYNGKFMINQMVLRGGSCATPKDHIRNTYRNFWHPHLRWQFNGIRLADHG